MKILVTGYQGFIGKNITGSLIADGHDLSYFEWGDDLPTIKGLDWVIHLGAITSTTERNIDLVMTQNYDFSCWLLDLCVYHRVNIQYASSASVYGLGSSFKETSMVDPKTPYAWSKYMVERYAAKYIKTNPTCMIQGFRYFNVYGPHEDHKHDQASPYHKFKLQADRQGHVTVFEDSEKYQRDFIHVDEVINIHKRFFNIKKSGLWNVGTGEPKSFMDVARTFTRNIKTIPMPENLKDSYQKYTCADLTRLKYSLTQEQK